MTHEPASAEAPGPPEAEPPAAGEPQPTAGAEAPEQVVAAAAEAPEQPDAAGEVAESGATNTTTVEEGVPAPPTETRTEA